MPRDKRQYFHKHDHLTSAQEQENETLVNQLAKEGGNVYSPPKVKLVRKDTTTFHKWPCQCHPNIVTKEKI